MCMVLSSTVDPMTFQGAALAWVAALTVVASAALWAVIKLWPEIQTLRDLANKHDEGILQNKQAIRNLNSRVSSVEEYDPVDAIVKAKAAIDAQATEGHD